MSHYFITRVLDSISELKHPRHLDFSYIGIQTVPKSFKSIYNLEALVLRGCQRLLELSQETKQLT